MSVNLQEIFYSIQGEGLYIGVPTCFVRFSGCNLACNYCDTKSSWEKVDYAKLPDNRLLKNPVAAKTVATLLDNYFGEQVSFTGGEPLLYPEFIKEVINLMSTKKTILLETNGTVWQNLEQIAGVIDIFSVDLKLNYWSEKYTQIVAFIDKIKKINKKHYFKIIVDHNWQKYQDYFLEIFALIGEADLVLQPLAGSQLSVESLLKFCYQCGKKNLHYIAQMHKCLGWR